jgi:hypothetical protein
MVKVLNLDPRKIKKETKKKIRTGLIILIVSVILLIVLLFFLGIKIRFVLRDELNVKVTPMDVSLSIKNNETVHIKLSIKNENFLQCKARCEFSLAELKNNTIVHTDAQRLEHKEEITKEYTLPAPGKGEGQLIYSFRAKCNNIKTGLCLTSEVPDYRSAIITINYELSDEEVRLKNKTRTEIEHWLDQIKEVYELLEQNRIISERLPSTVKVSAGSMTNELYKLESKKEQLVSIWNSENYILLDKIFLAKDIDEVAKLKEGITSSQNRLIEAAGLRNENIDLLGEVLKLKENVLDAADYYAKENAAKLNELSKICENIQSTYMIMKTNRDDPESVINFGLKSNVQGLKDAITKYEETLAKGLFLLIYGEAQLNVKNSASSSLLYGFSCSELKNVRARLDDENGEAIEYRNTYYNWSLGDGGFEAELNVAQREVELISLISTKDAIKKLEVAGKDYILNLIDNEIAVRNTTTATLSIPKAELYEMVVLDTEEYNKYVTKNCGGIINASPIPSTINGVFSINVSGFEKINLSIPLVEVEMETKLSDNPAMCCLFNKCNPCCEEGCHKEEPILFIHGHMVDKANPPELAMDSFARIQRKMSEDGIINIGELDITVNPYDVMQGEWGKSGKPVAVRASYYYITHYDVGAYTVEMQKSERIENYAIRLKEIINLLKYRTGADKVNIIAHSMGGLVTREYLSLFGPDNVDKVITVNSPHQGISGAVKQLCSVLGASKECSDMYKGSIFLTRLNSKPIPEGVEIHAIRSTGCKMDDHMGDGVVTNESAYLKGAQNYLIKGTCTDALQRNLHTNVLNPELYPQTYELIMEILRE